MSQVFSADSVNGGSVTLPPAVNTPAVTGNFINPPFGNAKAIVSAVLNVTPGTATAQLFVYLVRNPAKESVNLSGGAFTVNVSAGLYYQVAFQAADVIPDGRAVQYELLVYATGASAAGTINFSNVSVLLISG